MLTKKSTRKTRKATATAAAAAAANGAKSKSAPPAAPPLQQLSDQEQQKLLRDNKEQHALHDRHVVQTQQQRDAPPLPLGGNGLSLLDLIDTDNAECAENIRCEP